MTTKVEMPTKYEYDVFLSYSTNDRSTVLELANRLKADGLRVWFDEWVIQPGDPIPLSIQQGLKASRTLILLMSASFFESEWATFEHNTALFRDPINKERRFIPLLIDDCKIDESLKIFSYVDWQQKSDDQYQRLLKVLCRKDSSTKPLEQQDQAIPKWFNNHRDTPKILHMTGQPPLLMGWNGKYKLSPKLKNGRPIWTRAEHYLGPIPIIGVDIWFDGRSWVLHRHGDPEKCIIIRSKHVNKDPVGEWEGKVRVKYFDDLTYFTYGLVSGSSPSRSGG